VFRPKTQRYPLLEVANLLALCLFCTFSDFFQGAHQSPDTVSNHSQVLKNSSGSSSLLLFSSSHRGTQGLGAIQSCAAMAGVAGLLTSALVKIVGDKLGSTIGQQANLVWNFSRDLEDMKDTLESMAAVLKDAERRSIREDSVRLWLKRLKNAALDISDMLDEFEVNSKLTQGKVRSELCTMH
jgi:hypothetical protein